MSSLWMNATSANRISDLTSNVRRRTVTPACSMRLTGPPTAIHSSLNGFTEYWKCRV